MKRTSLSKKVRFEVFKRDKFTCQYCGASAPDVILEVDHIIPIAEGGTDDLFNLVSACFDCNRGKGKRRLSDDTEIKTQKAQLDELQERREQLKMMSKWREELMLQTEEEIDQINTLIAQYSDWVLNDNGRNKIRKLLRKFGFDSVYEATEIAFDKYFNGTDDAWENALQKIGGICYNKNVGRGADYYGY